MRVDKDKGSLFQMFKKLGGVDFELKGLDQKHLQPRLPARRHIRPGAPVGAASAQTAASAVVEQAPQASHVPVPRVPTPQAQVPYALHQQQQPPPPRVSSLREAIQNQLNDIPQNEFSNNNNNSHLSLATNVDYSSANNNPNIPCIPVHDRNPAEIPYSQGMSWETAQAAQAYDEQQRGMYEQQQQPQQGEYQRPSFEQDQYYQQNQNGDHYAAASAGAATAAGAGEWAQQQQPPPLPPRRRDPPDVLRAKQKLLAELESLKRKQIKLSRDYSLHDPLDDLKYEYELHNNLLTSESHITIMKKVLVGIFYLMEWGNSKFGPLLKLDGLGDSVCSSDQLSLYDHSLERIYYTIYRKGTAMNPFLELFILVVATVLIFNSAGPKSTSSSGAGGRGSGTGASSAPRAPSGILGMLGMLGGGGTGGGGGLGSILGLLGRGSGAGAGGANSSGAGGASALRVSMPAPPTAPSATAVPLAAAAPAAPSANQRPALEDF